MPQCDGPAHAHGCWCIYHASRAVLWCRFLQAMEAAQAKRLADQEAHRASQRAKYEAAGGSCMERRLQEQAK